MMSRRMTTLGLAISFAALAFLPGAADAQSADNYPTRAIRLIIPYPPGGATDIIGRTLAEKLEQQFKQSITIDNRGGAAQVIGTRAVAQADPDGYTLLLGSVTHSINPSLLKDLPYDS